MRNAVIYARYSSHSQTEMSIEGDGGSVRLADRLKQREEELESLRKQLK